MTRRAALALDVPARRELASKHGASALEVEDAAAWEAARDMGLTAGEYLRELAIDRALFESWDPEPRKARDAGDVYESRTPEQVKTAMAAIRATLAGDVASAGRAELATFGTRTDVVIVSNVRTGAAAVHRAVKTGTSASAGKRCKALTAKLGKAAVAARDAEAAVKTAKASQLASAVAAAEKRADTVAATVAKLNAKLELGMACHLAAACWDDVAEVAPEITVPAARDWFDSHRAPKCIMPARYRDMIRVHPDRAPSDPTGDLATSNRAEVEARRNAREVALERRIAADAAPVDPAVAEMERKARRTAAQRERRARARKAR
jgi:hypothetical protein